ncbi:RNA-directed DNA polymerase like [Apostasia shenzhenica]|uniref:RNA-directed DNA polymerase like n=1 Tax=Apostasia shenzhenica TaxID=1088818 RepID=A0A2I0B2E1_9ASPA|nr:RNA-directed DNA polymerase like [Apostasia shenzhenica]
MWQIRQAPDESLRNYVDRFSKMNAETKDTTDDRSTMIFVHSILPGELYDSFVDNMSKTLMEARARAEKRIHLEDAKDLKAKAKQEVASPQTKKGESPKTDSNTPRRSFRDRNYSPSQGKRKFEGESPRPATPVYIIEEIFSILSDKDFIKNCGERQPPQPGEDPTKFCKFHQRYGHLLFECRSFRALVNEYIENGYLTGYKGIEGSLPKAARPLFLSDDPRGAPSSMPATSKADGKKVVLSIFGYHSGLRTRRHQKVCKVELPPLLPDIIFTAGDLPRGRINRDDPIVVIAEIGACDVHRTLVDTGSSIDILYLCAFNEMVVGPCKPLPPSMTISSFSDDIYRPAGYATLRVALEEGPRRMEKEIDFIIMDAPSGYNAILGRPAIATFQMVASTYHLCLKFPTPFGVTTIRGDRAGASKCFEINARLHTNYMDPRDHALPPVEQNDHVTVADEKTVLISKNFPDNEKLALTALLFEYFDVFAWEPSDMPGIDRAVAEHPLSLKPGVAPVRQKKRNFGGEKQHMIREEVEKLLAAGFIREITYPSWLANVVVVKKNSGKWRMCVDFTDLNKACPKDFYPLPKIDRLVDSSAWYSVMSFVDAFSGYHQIRMVEDDEEHTSFITDQGTFCYKVMPFGLKNAGATYQRMIDTVFKNQRGRNVEAYVDDVLIKSVCVKQHLEDLREMLDTCRTYNIKLNPLKSIFGSSYGKFLGHMMSARGIEANPEKIQAIQEMKPPQTVQEYKS